MYIKRCPFPPVLKSFAHGIFGEGCWTEMVTDLFHAGHQILLMVFVDKNENTPVMLQSLASGYQHLFHSYRIKEAKWINSTGAQLQFLRHEVTGNVATPLGWDDRPLQGIPANFRFP